MRNYKNMKPENFFRALADPTRLRLLLLLLHHNGELCCCELSDSLLIPEYAVSRHIKILEHSGLVEARKESRWVYYHPSYPSTKFEKKLWESISALKGMWVNDAKRLRRRLKLREGGKCVLGPSHTPVRTLNLQSQTPHAFS